MNHQSISDLSSPDVAELIGRSRTAVVPFGSVEQHGPHLPCGTDTIAAEVVAEAVATEMGALYVPFGPYGVTPIHAGHPGTVNLRRSTFEALLTDVCEELIAMGVDRFVFVNWHEGNIASMDGVATEVQDRHPGVYVVTAHACYTAQRVYAGRGGELTHGGGIEALAVMAHDPSLVRVERAGHATRPDHAIALDDMRRSKEMYGYITDVTEIDDQGWYGDPAWATPELAAGFAATVAGDIAERASGVFDLRARQ
jgi:creatinine amidohydrolase